MQWVTGAIFTARPAIWLKLIYNLLQLYQVKKEKNQKTMSLRPEGTRGELDTDPPKKSRSRYTVGLARCAAQGPDLEHPGTHLCTKVKICPEIGESVPEKFVNHPRKNRNVRRCRCTSIMAGTSAMLVIVVTRTRPSWCPRFAAVRRHLTAVHYQLLINYSP
jgi:hypothetical protein